MSENRVTHAREYIEKLAFGYNDDNTCSAISTAMALNYLSLRFGRGFVPEKWMSQPRKAAIPTGALQIRADYPGTYSFHRYLVEKCDMRAVSYGDKITVPFRHYLEGTEGIDRGIELNWTLFPKASTIRANIDADLPVLITTTLAGDLSWHTMVCYGYRETDGRTELLVHNGWYGPEYSVRDEADDTAYQTETWVKKGIATYGYYFTLK
ncbi:MAG: hypothetical protein II694_01850 [Lachnospiraceae bacterium]|nr:hypothetical protein [Lachnospiraceae bacterium]